MQWCIISCFGVVFTIATIFLNLWMFALNEETKNIVIYYVNKGHRLDTHYDIDYASRKTQNVETHLVFFISGISLRVAEFEVSMRSLGYYSAGYCNITLHFFVDPYTKSYIQKFFNLADPKMKRFLNIQYHDLATCKAKAPRYITNKKTKFMYQTTLYKIFPELCLPKSVDLAVVVDFDTIFVDSVCKMVTHPVLKDLKNQNATQIAALGEDGLSTSGLPHYPEDFRGFNGGLMIFNLKKARDQKWTQIIVDGMRQWDALHPNNTDIPWFEQEVLCRLNFLKREYFTYLPIGFNMETGFDRNNDLINQIIQFDTKGKVILKDDLIMLHGSSHGFHYTRSWCTLWFLFSEWSTYYNSKMDERLQDPSLRAFMRQNIMYYLPSCVTESRFGGCNFDIKVVV
eukprot:Platyproteum_vivax@DN5763_c0_g1_i2.p1